MKSYNSAINIYDSANPPAVTQRPSKEELEKHPRYREFQTAQQTGVAPRPRQTPASEIIIKKTDLPYEVLIDEDPSKPRTSFLNKFLGLFKRRVSPTKALKRDLAERKHTLEQYRKANWVGEKTAAILQDFVKQGKTKDEAKDSKFLEGYMESYIKNSCKDKKEFGYDSERLKDEVAGFLRRPDSLKDITKQAREEAANTELGIEDIKKQIEAIEATLNPVIPRFSESTNF